MPQPTLSLLVLKTNQLEALHIFYKAVGLAFTEEKHGNGPVHFAGRLGNLVFEIYPLKNQETPDRTTRLGFSVPNLDEVLSALAQIQTPPLEKPTISPWGQRALVRDPDGRTVELYEKVN